MGARDVQSPRPCTMGCDTSVYHDLWYAVSPLQGGTPLAGVRFADLQSRPLAFLDVASLPLAEFRALLPPFAVACQAHMAAWRLDGKPRTARRFSVYHN